MSYRLCSINIDKLKDRREQSQLLYLLGKREEHTVTTWLCQHTRQVTQANTSNQAASTMHSSEAHYIYLPNSFTCSKLQPEQINKNKNSNNLKSKLYVEVDRVRSETTFFSHSLLGIHLHLFQHPDYKTSPDAEARIVVAVYIPQQQGQSGMQRYYEAQTSIHPSRQKKTKTSRMRTKLSRLACQSIEFSWIAYLYVSISSSDVQSHVCLYYLNMSSEVSVFTTVLIFIHMSYVLDTQNHSGHRGHSLYLWIQWRKKDLIHQVWYIGILWHQQRERIL